MSFGTKKNFGDFYIASPWDVTPAAESVTQLIYPAAGLRNLIYDGVQPQVVGSPVVDPTGSWATFTSGVNYLVSEIDEAEAFTVMMLARCTSNEAATAGTGVYFSSQSISSGAGANGTIFKTAGVGKDQLAWTDPGTTAPVANSVQTAVARTSEPFRLILATTNGATYTITDLTNGVTISKTDSANPGTRILGTSPLLWGSAYAPTAYAGTLDVMALAYSPTYLGAADISALAAQLRKRAANSPTPVIA